MNYERDLNWRIRIKKGRRTIREFSGNKLPISCKWDGKNEKGEFVKSGWYRYEISAWIEGEVSAEKVVGKVKIIVPEVKIVSVKPKTLILGYGNLKVKYKILPTNLPDNILDSATLEIMNRYGTFLFRDETISKSGGSYKFSWDGKCNREPYSGSYVNGTNNMYKVMVTIQKNNYQDSAEKEFEVMAKAFTGTGFFWYAGAVDPIKFKNLGYNKVYHTNWLFKRHFKKRSRKRLVWYSLSHGNAEGNIVFEIMRWKVKISPQDIPRNLNYTLVFLNACYSFRKARQWKSAFGAKAFVGWKEEVNTHVAGRFAKKFFSYLEGFHTVKEAFKNALDKDAKKSRPAYLGGNTIVELP